MVSHLETQVHLQYSLTRFLKESEIKYILYISNFYPRLYIVYVAHKKSKESKNSCLQFFRQLNFGNTLLNLRFSVPIPLPPGEPAFQCRHPPPHRNIMLFKDVPIIISCLLKCIKYEYKVDNLTVCNVAGMRELTLQSRKAWMLPEV